MAKALVAGVVALVLLPVAATATGAQQPRALQSFTLTMTEGELEVRAAEDPLPLEQPTTITGQHDTGEGGTGAVSGADLSTPPISFQTTASGIHVFVDAFFSSVTAASGTGSIDADGNVSLRTNVRVDLDLRLGSATAAPIRCSTFPVSLALDSTAPWDPGSADVTLRDADFTIPPVQATPACGEAIASAVNGSLAGSGNSLELTTTGALTLPTAARCPSLTTLTEVVPATSFQGKSVSMSAHVEADPAGAGSDECEDAAGAAPTGLVDFRAGDERLGSVELDAEGIAEMSFTTLPLGEQAVTARYRGDGAYSSSSSAAIAHTTFAPPSIVADLPPSVVIGADPVEFDVTLANSGLGADLENVRMDMTLRDVANGFPIPPGRLVFARLEPSGWVPVTFSGSAGSAQPATGAHVLPGGEVVQRLRVSSPMTAPSTRVRVELEARLVDPATGLPAPSPAPVPSALASTAVNTSVVPSGRIAPGIGDVTVAAHTVRQGYVVTVNAFFEGAPGAEGPSGSYRVLLDGRPVPIRPGSGPDEDALPMSGGVVSFRMEVPLDARLGQNEVTILYSGDDVYESASATATFAVVPPRGTLYECRSLLLFLNDLFNVYVSATGSVRSAAPAGANVDVRQLDVRLFADRGDTTSNVTSTFGPTNPVVPPSEDGVNLIDFRIGGASGTATALTTENNSYMFDDTRPVDPAPDLVLGFEGETATIPITGDPGDVVPVTLDSVQVKARVFGGLATLDLTCVPRHEPVSIGDVTVAGTTVSVDAPSPAREGDPVTISAAVAPTGVAGRVEFYAGTQTIGSALVGTDGIASMATRALPVGVHQVKAVFRGGSLVLPSAPVALEVRPVVECADFAEEGNGAVVRLVYMELLRRCPDQAGYDHWVGRLDGGTSPKVFARAIARSTEAVGLVVDDAYETVLGRAPDAGGRAFWVTRLQGHGRYDQLLADLGGSGEFWSLAGSTNEGFVTRVYGRLLDRAPDQGGLDHWVGRLEAGASRRALIVSLANLDEPLSRLVAASYDEILGRAPFSSERSNGIEYLRETGNRSGLYAQLIGRPEFDERAQGFPNPED